MGTDEKEISLRAFLRSLPSTAVWMLLTCIAVWIMLVWWEPNPPPFWIILVAWPAFTISLGPLVWLRYDRDSHTPGWWPAMAFALVWGALVAPLLLALVYGTAATLFDIGR
ncbi:hypothetical protein GA0074696_4553 [Micromonospora purpureochromogenes]|uniref:Uncharacterized protein n=1 Tax=Micromonospora purpureochromogenes TaxID=47872 RepID=A0A1C4ZK98_9ACTN|nr:hypothetical protein [Micromonospora purpureochromogenes]SCF33507.1 hypothetical protein GA0074696_4553 [Micromonospora purpureochromogenes]